LAAKPQECHSEPEQSEGEESLLSARQHERFFVAVLLRMTRTRKFLLKPK
jgi:hypothetical protein